MAFALIAVVAAATARVVVFDLGPERAATSLKRFTAGARDVVVDPRGPWARVPRMLPGAAEVWAGATPHAVTVRLGPRPARDLVLYLNVRETPDATPPSLRVTVNSASISAVATRRGSGAATPGGVPEVPARYRIPIPAQALGGGEARLSVVNEAGARVVLERVRLIEARPTFAWAHLKRRGPFPPESIGFVAASLASQFLATLGSAAGGARWRRDAGALGCAGGLILLSLAAVLPRDSFLVAEIPRWAWLALPWALLVLRSRAAGPSAPAGIALAPAVARPAPRAWARWARAILINGTLSLVVLAVSLLAAEVVLRIWFRAVGSAADTRAYFHRVKESVNSFGFREREFVFEKSPGVYRIAALGDSLTWAWVAADERFSNLIERSLNEQKRREVTYEVLNFGFPGFDTEHELSVLRELVVKARPDFVLLQWYMNDFENGVHGDRPEPFLLVRPVTLHRKLLRSSALYSLLDPKWRTLQEKLGLIETFPEYMYRRFGDPESRGSIYEMELLAEFIGECRTRGIPMGIVLFPAVEPGLVTGAYDYDYLHERVLAACSEEHVPCVDLRATFAPYGDYRQLWVTPLDPHPSALANRLAAERLLDAFGPVWLSANLARGRPGVATR